MNGVLSLQYDMYQPLQIGKFLKDNKEVPCSLL